MKRLIAITGAVLLVYLIFTAVIAADRPGVAIRDSAPAATAAPVYVLCAENDRLVVLRDSEVYLRTDTAVSSLPKSDRLRLTEGIAVFSEKELKSILEDYCS